MPDRYEVKQEGVVKWTGMAKSLEEAFNFAHAEKEIPADVALTATIISDNPEKKCSVCGAPSHDETWHDGGKKARKPREKKAATPAKRIRGGMYYIVPVNIARCKTKEELNDYLETHVADNESLVVIQGRELHFERKVSFSFKPVKSVK